MASVKYWGTHWK